MDHGLESGHVPIIKKSRFSTVAYEPWTQPPPPSAERITTTSCTHVTLHHTLLNNLSQMHRKQSNRRKAKYLKREKGSMSSIKGVSHLSRRTKRRLYCKLQLWMWRKRREKCRFAIFRAKKQACGISSSSSSCLSVKTRPQKNKSNVVSSLGCDTGGLEGTLRRQNCLQKLCQTGSLSETFVASSFSQNVVTDANVSAGNIALPAATMNDEPLLSIDNDACGLTTHFKEPRTLELSQSLEVEGPSGQLTTAPPGQDQAANINTDERITGNKTTSCESDASLNVLIKDVHGRSFFFFILA